MRWVGHVARGWTGELHTGFWWENIKEIDHLKDLGVNGNVQEVGWESTDWNDLAQNRDRWRAIMNTIMYFRFP